jgi:PAS domain-containing protein
MDLALGSTAAPQDASLHTAAFEFAVEPALLLDPHADLILDANPAACALLGYDRALLRQTKVSTLHAGQLP